MLKFFEFDDIVGLVAPRPFLGISGLRDHIFPYQGCEDVIASAAKIYGAYDATDSIRSVAGQVGHRFYSDTAWPAFEAIVGDA